MKIVFLNLYPAETIAKYQLAPYLLKAYFNQYYKENLKCTIEILNFSNSTDIATIYQQVVKSNPDIIGYSCYTWNIESISQFMTQFDGQQKVHILGGPEITHDRIPSLPKLTSPQYFVIGEGEQLFLELILHLFCDYPFPKGVAYWKGQNIHYEPSCHSILNLDDIPSIYLTNTIEDHLYYGQQAFLETQRGCQFRCQYCVYHKTLPKVVQYSKKRIFQEIDYLIIEKKIRILRIFDSVFTHDLEKAKDIVRHLIELKKKAKIPWIYWELTYYNLDEEFLSLVAELKDKEKVDNFNTMQDLDRPQHYFELMKYYNVINSLGIQSFNEKSVKAVSRMRVNPNIFNKLMHQLREKNVIIKADIILGLPFETMDSYFNGLEHFFSFIRNTDHIVNIHRLQMLPGSDLMNVCSKFQIKHTQDSPFYVLSTNSLTEQEMDFASRLSGILFRIINSPLRESFFIYKDQTQFSTFEIANQIYHTFKNSDRFNKIKLLQEDVLVEDQYWNSRIYSELPSAWLLRYLKKEKLNVVR